MLRYFMYCKNLSIILYILCLFLCWQITGTILAVLGIGREGVASLEFIPKGLLLRFLQDSDMGDVILTETEFGSLPDQPLELSASHQGKVCHFLV
jgi:hypothetical protein